MSTPPSAGHARLRVLGTLLAVLIVVALVALVLFRGQDGAADAGDDLEVLRLQGSNTVGTDLAPDLAEAYLTARGAPAVQRSESGGVQTLSGTLPDGELRIEVRAGGTETAFDGLAAGVADVGMASRRAAPADGGAAGDLTTRESEHVLALDALAVIVRPETGVSTVSVGQLRDVYTCAVTDWSQLGGTPGPIRLLARDDASGTWESFRDAVLAGAPLCPTAERFADSAELARTVGADPRAIGVVGLPFAGGNRVLELYDGSSTPTAPTALSVATESYLLTRRLFLYLPQRAGPRARDLVEFSLSEAGQRLVEADGFVSPLFPPPVPAAPPCTDAPPAYCAATGGAQRVPFDVRFDSGTDQVDNRAFRNLDLLAASLAGTPGRQVLLIGFADNAGTDPDNQALSDQRSAAVQRYLADRGVTNLLALGFGEALPVDTNDTPEGREQNRRVEVWLR